MTGLQLRGIRKAFKGVQVLDGVDLDVAQREFIAFLGPSGSGKSTLLRIIAGLETSDGGEIVLDDEVQHFTGPGDAMAAGIGMVHQHFMLIPVFTVAENVMLGNENTGFAGTLDLGEAAAALSDNVIPWPGTLPEQVRAVQSILASSPAPLAAQDVARAFKGKHATAVRPVLDALASVGMARRLGNGCYAA